jgi:hypothetical protein
VKLNRFILHFSKVLKLNWRKLGPAGSMDQPWTATLSPVEKLRTAGLETSCPLVRGKILPFLPTLT